MLTRLLGTSALACALLLGCAEGTQPGVQDARVEASERQLRAAVQSAREAFMARDYAATWEFMAASSRDALAKQLHSLRSVLPNSAEEETAEELLGRLGMRHAQLSGMDAREYFITMFESLDRAQPEMRRRQTEQLRRREIIQVTITGDLATVHMGEPTGDTEALQWVRENGEWKHVASDVGKGVELK